MKSKALFVAILLAVFNLANLAAKESANTTLSANSVSASITKSANTPLNSLNNAASSLANGVKIASANATSPQAAAKSTTTKPKEALKIGATPVPFGEILEFAKPLFAQKGYELEIVEFNDFAVPNVALNDGKLDANFFQHKPYLSAFNESKGTRLVAINSVAIIPMAIYSKKVASLDALKNGALVSVPNDPSNEDRAFELLEKAKLVEFRQVAGFKTPRDVAKNPKKLKFRELKAAQLPRSLDDVDIAVINANYALDFGLNPTKDALLIEDKNSPYAVVFVVRPEDTQSVKTRAIDEVLRSDAVREFILKKYGGNVVPTF